MGEQAGLAEQDLQAIQGLFGGVEQDQLARAKSGQARAECAADGAARAGDKDGSVAESVECCGGWGGQSWPGQEDVPVDSVGW